MQGTSLVICNMMKKMNCFCIIIYFSTSSFIIFCNPFVHTNESTYTLYTCCGCCMTIFSFFLKYNHCIVLFILHTFFFHIEIILYDIFFIYQILFCKVKVIFANANKKNPKNNNIFVMNSKSAQPL